MNIQYCECGLFVSTPIECLSIISHNVVLFDDAFFLVWQEMKTRAHGHSTDIRQIDLDVNRTYRDHEMFRKRYRFALGLSLLIVDASTCSIFSIKQRELFHVLAAYSMYNTEVGYCQGMSQIAALLLMYMSEEVGYFDLECYFVASLPFLFSQ